MSIDGEAARQATSRWLQAQGLREVVTPEELAELRTLLAPHKGFGIFWSLVAYDRAQAMVELSNVDLSTPAGVSRASVLQGQIRAVDGLRETILYIADPVQDAATALDRQGD